MNSKRPATISVKNLSAAVERAVTVVQQKNNVQFASGLLIAPTIAGKQLNNVTEIAQAEQAAASLTQELSAVAGVSGAESAVLVRGGIVLCGFIAPENASFVE
jgi:phosphatidylserine decarboxylase